MMYGITPCQLEMRLAITKLQEDAVVFRPQHFTLDHLLSYLTMYLTFLSITIVEAGIYKGYHGLFCFVDDFT